MDDRVLAKLFASRLIARPDVFAIQRRDGSWNPVRKRITMDSLLDHIRGRESYGHYLLNENNQCKFFAFDIDLEKAKPEHGLYYPVPSFKTGQDWRPESFMLGNPRELWSSPKALEVQKDFLALQLRSMTNILLRAIWNLHKGKIPVAAAYSGSKGVHVYAFFGRPIDAWKALEAAEEVIECVNDDPRNEYYLEPYRGKCFYKHKDNGHPIEGYQQISIEIFPKQVDLRGGEQLGNLMRLPTGYNLKGGTAHFIDTRSTLYTRMPVRDPIEALTTANPWEGVI